MADEAFSAVSAGKYEIGYGKPIFPGQRPAHVRSRDAATSGTQAHPASAGQYVEGPGVKLFP